MTLDNRVVLITGASSGIGEATARAFVKAGAKVAIAARRKERLDKISTSLGNCFAIPTDLSDEEQTIKMVDDVVNHFGKIDILINNAALIIVSQSDTVKSEDMIRAFRTNLLGPMAATNKAIQYMNKQGGGQIINVGSPGFMIGVPLYAPYVCSKAALSAWTRTIQAEWADSNIIVSEYFPGYIKTDSKPESEYENVEQDITFDPDQKGINKIFTKPKSAEVAARHLIKLAIKPKPLKHSGFAVKLGSFIALFPGFRLSIASKMAKNVRKRLNLNTFTNQQPTTNNELKMM